MWDTHSLIWKIWDTHSLIWRAEFAAPMIGGMVTTLLLTLCVIPALFRVWRRGKL